MLAVVVNLLKSHGANIFQLVPPTILPHHQLQSSTLGQGFSAINLGEKCNATSIRNLPSGNDCGYK